MKNYEEYKKYIMEKLDDLTDILAVEIMDKEGVTSGDIFPEQKFNLENSYETIAKILLEVVKQNKNQ